MKIFPLTIYVLLKPFIQILPSDSKKSLWDSRTTATLAQRYQNWLLVYKQYKDPAAFFGICYENLVQICTNWMYTSPLRRCNCWPLGGGLVTAAKLRKLSNNRA
jgi:hypothetical protein